MTRHHTLMFRVALALSVGSFGFQLLAQSPTSTKHPYASDRALSEPTVFAEGIVSTGDFDSHPVFTPDGKTLYFLRSTPTFSLWTIVFTRFEKGSWTTPQVAPFATGPV